MRAVKIIPALSFKAAWAGVSTNGNAADAGAG